jgi:hypothetical protein
MRSSDLSFVPHFAADFCRNEAERARATAQATSTANRKFWLALATNWEKLADDAEAPKIKQWAT